MHTVLDCMNRFSKRQTPVFSDRNNYVAYRTNAISEIIELKKEGKNLSIDDMARIFNELED